MIIGLRSWCVRCIPGFSLLALFALIVFALTDPSTWLPYYNTVHFKDPNSDTLTLPQAIYAVYNVLIHVLALIFPLRLCWSLRQITHEVQGLAFQRTTPANVVDIQEKNRTIGSPAASLSPITSGATSDDDDSRKRSRSLGMVYHTILLPNYKEDINTFRETLDVLASHAQARSSYDVWLAMEEKDPNAKSIGSSLVEAYSKYFHTIHYSVHPSGLEGEVQGKSSNISWAAHEAARMYQDLKSRQNCIMTVMDADTHLSANYFGQLSKQHFEFYETASTTLYAAPIIFDRNAHKVPALVRLADVVWCAAGLSGLYPGSTIIIPTSVYSIPLPLVELVGGWDTGSEALGEDLHMYLKCYFAVAGHLTTRVVYSPASQSNVVADSQGIRGWMKSIQARYNQAMRHMWGSLDTGYACSQAGLLMSGMPRGSGYDSPTSQPIARSFSRCLPKLSLAMLIHRLFEAHFLTVHLFMLLLSNAAYQLTVPLKLTPPWLLTSMNVAGNLRAAAFVCMLCAFYFYESYHAVCVRTREDEMRRARLYEQMRGDFSRPNKRGLLRCLQYFLFPVSGIIFVTTPSVIAQLCHFWTDRLEYKVSKKPSAGPAKFREDPKV